jgi:kynurenine 3-monooxygenase
MDGMKIAIIGGGPSGLLLAHYLARNSSASVTVWERRPDPSAPSPSSLGGRPEREQRAYALGIGRRGRTALQLAGAWQSVKSQGCPSERFDLHLNPKLPALRLRDEGDGVPGNDGKAEPSILLFQSDLCRVLTQDLKSKYSTGTKINMNFDTGIESIDLDRMELTAANADGRKELLGGFNLIVGCDGVKSVVRKAMADRYRASFESKVEKLPGEYKVVARGPMPPQLDRSAVALLFPRTGSVTAFVEPTVNGTACVLFAGRNRSDALLSSADTTLLAEEVLNRFPKLEGLEALAAAQLAQQSTATASKVVCNTFHGRRVALVGDAAHATGGVSGQGVNSALSDARVLAECLLRACSASQKSAEQDSSIQEALLEYSTRQVPEAAALYDLSFGPTFDSPIKRLQWGAKSVIDAVFKGRWGIGALPLQTLLTTSLRSFAEIRRDRQSWYADEFPSNVEWQGKLSRLHDDMMEESRQKVT